MGKGAVIKVENVSKKYCISLKRSMLYGVRDIARNTLGLSSHSDKLRKDEFWALDDVSFEVKKGETLGIIGPNGAGKTTMLKMLNGIFWPDKGKITVRGRVGALIEVGAGFHPLLTGRENVYINAAILGMTKKEVDEKFNDIIEFAEIGDFIDTPVKFYSSGMYVRLGFAIAIHCEPEILLIDEVLAVGDMNFRTKCYAKMSEILDKGCALVFVSHNMVAMHRVCKRVILLKKGKVIEYGSADSVCNSYSNEMILSATTCPEIRSPVDLSKVIQINSVQILNHKGSPTSDLDMLRSFKVGIEYSVRKPVKNSYIACHIHTPEGIWLVDSCDVDCNPEFLLHREPGCYTAEVTFPGRLFNSGRYYVSIYTAIPMLDLIFDKIGPMVINLHDTGSVTTKSNPRRPTALALELPWKTTKEDNLI